MLQHHPNIKILDVSELRNFSIFSHFIINDINKTAWKGGFTGAIALSRSEAKLKAISEALERTFLAKINNNVWSSAAAPSFKLADMLTKQEALEEMNAAFNCINQQIQIVQLQDSPEIFIGYTIYSTDWRKIKSLPIV